MYTSIETLPHIQANNLNIPEKKVIEEEKPQKKKEKTEPKKAKKVKK